MMTHDEAWELLGVYALDAVDGEERDDLEAHVALCVRCSSELDALRAVSSSMGNHGEPASPALWERISSHLYDDVGPTAPVRPLVLTAAAPDPRLAARHARRRRPTYVISALTLAAAVLVGLFSVALADANHHITQLNSALKAASTATEQSLARVALATPGHQEVTLSGGHSASLARFVLVDGHGYLISSNMAALPATETYQLWGIVHGTPISLGVMGSKPSRVTFTFAGTAPPSEMAITVEPSGGSVQPTSPIIAKGRVAV